MMFFQFDSSHDWSWEII
ncbi:unnamed protein product [Acanthoscelides obtectus]|uniref:Uncharacterized protein n=1 Tax=Acanthoscelides obtectus TaxID=200917 RepID=A0A9P0LYC1_ACAOB|nr:unnamed protein product [Acanthoscelides obtectus]CAK1620484.1 hypothetical protein AOBTE_LOCUS395 [Acanthoscelides obtectus]